MTEPNADAKPQDQEPSAEDHGVPQTTAMSRGQLAEAKEYGRRELQCTLIDMVLDVIYLTVMAFGAAIVIDRWLLAWPLMSNAWMRLAALYIITMGIHYGLSFPLTFYSDFLLEHKFGMSRQSFGRWLWRYGLQNVLVVILGLVLMLGLYAIIWWTGSWWWVVAALATFVVTVLLGQFVPVLILPLFYKIERLDDEALIARLDQLTRGTSLDLEGVYRMKTSSDTAKANALLAGLGRTRRVILGDTLLDEFETDEIEVVFAHEIGHHVYHHIPKLMLLGLVYSAISYYVCDWVLFGWVQAQEGVFDYHQLPVYTLPVVLLIITLSSLVLSPLRNALSRRFETACDRYALQQTANGQAYQSAFTKLAQLNKADPDPHPLEVILMHDHPPIATRLALARTIHEVRGEEL